MVMRAGSFDGNHEFLIGPGCTKDGAGNVLSYNTFTSFDGDPRHILEYTPDKKGLVWTRPDGTRVVYAGAIGGYPGCATPDASSLYGGFSIAQVEYPNGFTVTGGYAGTNGQVNTNTGYQLAYIYAKKPEVDPYYGASQASQPWALKASDLNWSVSVPAYVVAINNTIDYCGSKPAGAYTSVADACPGLTEEWPFAKYDWPVGMPRVLYLTDRTATFTVTDAMGGVTKYVHKPFLATLGENPTPLYEPRIYQIQGAKSEVPDFTYDYQTKSVAVLPTMYPLYIAGPAALLTKSTQNTADITGYTIGAPYGQGGMSVNASGGVADSASVMVNHTYGPFQIELWDKTINLEMHQPNKLISMYRKTDGVTLNYGYDTRYNLTEIKEGELVTTTALYPASCEVATRKTCNKPTWTKDANGNQTDYEYDATSGQVKRMRMPADPQGVRPEIRYEYQPKYAYYKRSAGGAVEKADAPLYLLTREIKCASGAMSAAGTCSSSLGVNDLVETLYDYGPSSGANNLLLRGVSVTAASGNIRQTRRTCYSYDVYGNKIGETKPQAGLASCN
jgi:YD repeat-containing protein